MNIALMDNMRLPPSLSRMTTSAAFARISFSGAKLVPPAVVKLKERLDAGKGSWRLMIAGWGMSRGEGYKVGFEARKLGDH
jgi:hypothetical protein